MLPIRRIFLAAGGPWRYVEPVEKIAAL